MCMYCFSWFESVNVWNHVIVGNKRRFGDLDDDEEDIFGVIELV